MSRRTKHQSEDKPKLMREQFPDGSALITYPDGSVLILESDLAKEAIWHESRPVDYNDPPPPPVAES